MNQEMVLIIRLFDDSFSEPDRNFAFLRSLCPVCPVPESGTQHLFP